MDPFTDTNPLHEQADERLPAAAYLDYENRADGWSAGRQAAFLAHLADNGVVADAARAVGKHLSGGYALRRQARGYAFNLAWEAALIIARRIVADDLMTAAIRGEQSRWVREDGVTTYTRQNSKLALTLLDRVNPATTLPEVMAVATRFDWFLELIERGASSEDLWTYFFDDALPHSIGPARARVRAALLLSEESDGFEKDDDGDDAPIEYKSMEGPVSVGAELDLEVFPPSTPSVRTELVEVRIQPPSRVSSFTFGGLWPDKLSTNGYVYDKQKSREPASFLNKMPAFPPQPPCVSSALDSSAPFRASSQVRPMHFCGDAR